MSPAWLSSLAKMTPGARYAWNSFSACSPRLVRSTRKQHPPGAAELDQPVDLGDGGFGYAEPEAIKDQRAGPVAPERLLQVGHRLDLVRPD